MPVKDREKRRLPKLGTIRLGYMETRKRDGREYSFPVQADHFILRDAPKLAEYFAQRKITEPRALDVILPFPTLQDNYDASYAVWANGVLLCRGDGERVLFATPMRVAEDKKGTHVYNEAGPTLIADGVAQCNFSWGEVEFVPGQIVPCPGSNAEGGHPHCAACRMSAILKVTPYADEIFEFGYYQLTTGSWRNHETIMGTLESLPPGALAGHLPFTLRMVEESTIYQDKDGKRKATTRWFLQLMPHPDKLKALFMRETQHYIEGTVERPALPAAVDYEAEPTSPPPYAEREAWDRAMRGEESWPEDPDELDEELGEVGWSEEPEEEEDPLPAEPPPEPPPNLPPQAPPKPKENKAIGRPYDPETLRRRVVTVAGNKRRRGKAKTGEIGLVWALMGQMWSDPKLHVHRLLEYLFEETQPDGTVVAPRSLDECDAKQVSSLIDWLRDPDASESGHHVLDPRSKSEANAVVRLMLEREGQQMLPGMEGGHGA